MKNKTVSGAMLRSEDCNLQAFCSEVWEGWGTLSSKIRRNMMVNLKKKDKTVEKNQIDGYLLLWGRWTFLACLGVLEVQEVPEREQKEKVRTESESGNFFFIIFSKAENMLNNIFSCCSTSKWTTTSHESSYHFLHFH